MTLSVELIAESMQPFGALVVMQQERTFAFRRVQMLTPESENALEEDVLYVSEPRVIRRLPKGLLRDHFFVVRARPEDAEPVRPGVNALLYDEQYSLGAVTNHLLMLFDRLQTLEYQMRLAVRAHAGLEPLMEVGRKMIPDATIVVVDSAYNIIGATRERGSGNIYVDQMLEQGYYDKDSLQLMAEAGYFEVSDRYLRPVLSVPPNICNDPVILRSYIANGMFYSFAGCYFPGRLPTMADTELFRCFIVVKINWRLTPAEQARMLARNRVSVAFLKAEKPEWGAELERLRADSVRLIRLEPVAGRSALCALVSGEPDTPLDVPVSRDDVACRLHTSGTTGEPKCVVYTHGGMLREIVSMLQVYPYPDGQRYQFIAQLFHSAAIGAHLSLATGGTMVLKDHFALEDYMHTLVSERIESISVVPTVLKWILDETDNGDYDLSHLKTVNYSTCPIPKALLQRAIEKLHCSFYQSYGMTEMGSTVTALLPEDHLRDGGKYLSSVGRPIPGAAVRIVAPDGSECPAGTAGEIYVRGPGRMLEYLDAPETTHAVLVDGWYRTKDMGMLDEQGYLFLSGRADDLIISGGENIYPGEVTNVIMQLCDDVAEVAVYGVPDETWGEHVKASVVLMPGSRLTAEALRQYCRAHMPTFRAPKEIEIVPELPKGATGKVLTAVLRARSVQAS